MKNRMAPTIAMMRTTTRTAMPALKATVWVTGTDAALDTADAVEVLPLVDGLGVEPAKGLVVAVIVVLGSEVAETRYDNVKVVEILMEEAEEAVLALPKPLSSTLASACSSEIGLLPFPLPAEDPLQLSPSTHGSKDALS
jgi:hypothetical protein